MSVGLTFIEVFLIVVALAGFWILRGVVERAACEVADEAAREEVRENLPKVRRDVLAWVQSELENAGQQSGTVGSSDIARAMGGFNDS